MLSFRTCVLLSVYTVTAASNDSNAIFRRIPRIYWNIPSFQCDYHRLNFTGLAQKYGLIQNEKDRFRGQHIDILYDPGAFPAILQQQHDGMILRNGGVPQAGNLSLHLSLFEELVDQLIPDQDFSGLAVIDFESWRPIFRQNFGTLVPYKTLSIELEKDQHPDWPDSQIVKKALQDYETAARLFMEETLLVAKQLRPNATWGYYAYPYCFNKSPGNMGRHCSQMVVAENDRLDWLWGLVDALHPSLYLPELRLNSTEKQEMIDGRIDESHRLADNMATNVTKPQIIPYFWYKYQDTKAFLSKEDALDVFELLSTLDLDGLVIWGSSDDVNTKKKCYELYAYIDEVLGPIIVNSKD